MPMTNEDYIENYPQTSARKAEIILKEHKAKLADFLTETGTQEADFYDSKALLLWLGY